MSGSNRGIEEVAENQGTAGPEPKKTDNQLPQQRVRKRKADGQEGQGEKLSDSIVRDLPAPPKGNKITYDGEVKGFGVRVTSAGAKAFILNYRAKGRERRITIGSYPDWKTTPARDRAKVLKREIDSGGDPMGERHDERAAKTVNNLADRFEAEHLYKRRPATRRDYEALLRRHIRPALGKTRVAEVTHAEIERLHARIAAETPYMANRTVAVLSKMFNLAIKWGYRADNPVKGVERAPEEKRERFLSPAEIERLAGVLAAYPERDSANAIRLLLLTGARRGEVLGARWSEFDLAAATWTKPSAHTKQKKEHRVPLSAPTIALLTQMQDAALSRLQSGEKLGFVFPGAEDKALQELKRTWLTVCKQAGLAEQVEKLDAKGKPVADKDGKPVLEWKTTARIHDLRHSFASILASSGLSLPIIGRLLGHTQAATTARYAHLMDDPLRAATERVGAVVAPKKPLAGGVVDISAGRGGRDGG